MNKQNRNILTLLIIGVLGVYLWPRDHSIPSPHADQGSSDAPNSKFIAKQITSHSKASQPSGDGSASPANPDVVNIYLQRILSDPEYDRKQPINFFGKVVDENDKPVSGATVKFSWSDPSIKGNSEAQTISDADGLFSLVNQTGKRLFVDVRKEGYYASLQNWSSYEYANPADGLFTPDRAHPIIFHLRKRGEAEPLARCEQKIPISLNSVVSFDPRTCQVGANDGMVEFQLLNNQSRGPNGTEWEIGITVPNGGVLIETNEFPFAAPTAGYQTSVKITLDTPKPGTWQNNGYAGGVVIYKTESNYGRLEIRMIPGASYFRLVSFYNPSGSPNLEFDPNNAIQPGQ